MVAPENLFTLTTDDVPLCVECLTCRHRAVLEAAVLKHLCGLHDMSPLTTISRRLKCAQCGSKAVRTFRPLDRSLAATFLIGASQSRG